LVIFFFFFFFFFWTQWMEKTMMPPGADKGDDFCFWRFTARKSKAVHLWRFLLHVWRSLCCVWCHYTTTTTELLVRMWSSSLFWFGGGGEQLCPGCNTMNVFQVREFATVNLQILKQCCVCGSSLSVALHKKYINTWFLTLSDQSYSKRKKSYWEM